MYAHGKFLEYTHRGVTIAISTVYTTMDYDYRHKNIGTNLILVPRKFGVYICDQNATRCVQYWWTWSTHKT